MEETKENVSVAKETMDIKKEAKKGAIFCVVANAIIFLVGFITLFTPLFKVVSEYKLTVESKSLISLIVDSVKAENISGVNTETLFALSAYRIATYWGMLIILLVYLGEASSNNSKAIFILSQPTLTVEGYAFQRGGIGGQNSIFLGISFLLLAVIVGKLNQSMVLGVGFYIFLISYIVGIILQLVGVNLFNPIDKKLGLGKPKKR